MGKAPDSNFAGPLQIDSEVLERDAQIRETNDGKPVEDLAARSFIQQNKLKIFGLQSKFFSELRDKLGK